MKRIFSPLLLTAALLVACSDDSGSLTRVDSSSSTESSSAAQVIPVDYSAGRAMNQRLGKGINLGNSWDSKSYPEKIPDEPYNFGYNDYLDGGWGNPIEDGDFKIVKDAGFNSIRLPVRWQHNSNPTTHEVNPERLAGVVEDVGLAIQAGLVVIVDFHWYQELMNAGNNFIADPVNNAVAYEAEKVHFYAIWNQVATELNKFPDSMLVFDILNEPTFNTAEVLNDVMIGAYNVIRNAAPRKTIMFESNAAAKFGLLEQLKLPQDGNIIFSGHYYEPYTFTHEGHGYNCKGDDAYSTTASTDMAKYVAMAQSLYPDVNGGHIPMNMGEFGVAAGARSGCGNEGPSDKYYALWSKKAVAAAEKYGLSWTYWGFTKVGGFEAYDRENSKWYPGILDALGLTN